MRDQAWVGREMRGIRLGLFEIERDKAWVGRETRGIRLGLFEIERDKAWVGREMRGIRLGLCLGQVRVRRFGSGSGCVWVGPEWVWVSWVQSWAGLGFG